MSHQIKEQDFVDLGFDDSDIPYICKRILASSAGMDSHKSLKVVSNIKTLQMSFEVSDGLTKTTSYALKDAIALYNSLA